MSITEPMTKASIRSVDTGMNSRHMAATMSTMGITEETDSLSFSSSIVLLPNGLPPSVRIWTLLYIIKTTLAEKSE